MRWCPHRPLPPHGDVTTRRVAPFLVHIGYRVLPANIILASVLACHATLQPRPFASKDRRKQLLRVQPERNGKRKRDEARVPSQDRRISYTSVKRKARAESLIFAFRRAFLRLERKFRPRAKRGRLATRGGGHVIRRIIGQNFVAARIYVVYVCVCVCVLVRERERDVICPLPLPFFNV